MPRRARVRYEGAIYHVMNRGIDRRRLFMDDKDRATFLESLEIGVERFLVRVHAYCLLRNHFHLLIETPLGNVDRFMQGVQGRYAGYFNLRHGKSGYVYEGPYRAKLVADDSYLLRLSRYVHLNAVRVAALKGKELAEVVAALRAYRWSSYPAYIGMAPRYEWMTYGEVEAHVGELMGRKAGAYRRFVEAGLAETDEEFEAFIRGRGVCLGDAEALRELEERLERRAARRGTEGFGGPGMVIGPERVLGEVLRGLKIDEEELSRRRGSAWMRGVAAEMLCRYGGLTNVQAAEQLGLGTGAAVCIRRRALREQLRTDKRLVRQVKGIEKRLVDALF